MKQFPKPTMDYNSSTSFPVFASYNDSYVLNCKEKREWYFEQLQPKEWLLALYCVFFVLGVFGNGILVLLFFIKRNLRTINNAFVTNLALSDFLFVILYAPIKYFEEAYGMRPFGITFCRISIVINYSSQDVSTLSMTALSYLRYRAVMLPLRIRQDDHTLKWVIPLCCGITWVVGIVAAIFPASFCKITTDDCWTVDRHYVDSYTNRQVHLIFHIVRFIFFYLLPLTVIVCFYFRMAMKLCRKPSSLQRNDSISVRRATRSRRRLGGIVLAIVVIFFLSWLPNYITWFTGLDDGIFPPLLPTIRNVCMFFPACLNPILFFATSSRYRKSLYQIFSPSAFRRLRSSSLTASLASIRLSRLGRFSKRSSSDVPLKT